MAAGKELNGSRILRMRIGFALRRATGKVVDVDAMLSRPQLVSRRLQTWRDLGSSELNSLIDQLESVWPAAPDAELGPAPRLAEAPGPQHRA